MVTSGKSGWRVFGNSWYCFWWPLSVLNYFKIKGKISELERAFLGSLGGSPLAAQDPAVGQLLALGGFEAGTTGFVGTRLLCWGWKAGCMYVQTHVRVKTDRRTLKISDWERGNLRIQEKEMWYQLRPMTVTPSSTHWSFGKSLKTHKVIWAGWELVSSGHSGQTLQIPDKLS